MKSYSFEVAHGYQILFGCVTADTKEEAEKIAEMLENGRKPDEELSDNDRDLLEDFMEFLNQKQK